MDPGLSPFDAAYLAAWERLKSTPGLFRNPQYEATQRRPLAGGATGAICQFNEEHLKNKRPTSMKAADLRVVREFDPALFNFLRAKPEEVVARVELDAGDADATPALLWAAGDGAPQPSKGHPFFANISPIMGAHGLLVPDMEACHPQVMTPARLATALRVMGLSARRDFHLGFNSLAAWASVNHCHFHVTYVSDAFPDGRFPVESAGTTQLAEAPLPAAPGGGDPPPTLQLAALTEWPLGGFRFSLGPPPPQGAPAPPAPHQRHAAALAAAAGHAIAHMTAHEVAHNLLLADRGRTVYVLPRAHQAGGGADEGRMAVAFAESCGIAIVYSQAVFDGFTEGEYVAALEAYRIGGPAGEAIAAAAVAGVRAAAAAAGAQ